MNDMKKKVLAILLIILAAVFINGCVYVFHGQFKSVEKIRRRKELSGYEIASIYTMHIAICTVGWIFSPEATIEVIGMSFRKNRDRVIHKESSFFLKFPVIEKVYRSQYARKRIAFNGDISYALTNPDHRLALAVNPGYLWRDKKNVYLEVPVHYPKCFNTHIGLFGGMRITVNECLFSYLEEKEILHPYTIIYQHTIN